MFRKELDEGIAGDNIGVLLRGVEKEELERGMVIAKPRFDHTSQKVHCSGLRIKQRGRRTTYSVLLKLYACSFIPVLPMSPGRLLNCHRHRDGYARR